MGALAVAAAGRLPRGRQRRVLLPDGERSPAREVREARAKAICARCPVIGECATYALVAGERHGVWGGLSERDRAALRLGA